MTTSSYDFGTETGAVVTDAASQGKDVIQDNFGKAMLVTLGFVLWRIGRRVIQSVK